MSDREKLIELFGDIGEMLAVYEAVVAELGGCENGWIKDKIGFMADYLISNGVTVQKWIPVSERLPELGQEVLVTLNNSCGIMAVWRLFRSTISEVIYWEDEVGDELYVEAASHWMPLPELPKECE